jgi:hypothetical protein
VKVPDSPPVRAFAANALVCALGFLLPWPATLFAQRGIAERAAEYVADYQRQLTAIVADEQYVQEILRQVPADPGAPQARSTNGEVFFIFTAPSRGWMAIRDVQTVDGAPAPERTDVREILRTLPVAQVGAQMASYNARYNIGRITRNFNEPTLALLSLDESHRERFRFATKQREDVDGHALIWLAFEEKERPTLIRNVQGRPVFIKGELLVEMASGRIWQSRLRATVEGINVELVTVYRFDERLGLMLPILFRESYEKGKPAQARTQTPDPSLPYEQIACEAKYSNFRRFEVFSRIR